MASAIEGRFRMSLLSGDPRSLSVDAYAFLYPLVTMGVTRRQTVNVEVDAKPGFGSGDAALFPDQLVLSRISAE